nr:hypothetical protein [Tanacetum cinerariifolium]
MSVPVTAEEKTNKKNDVNTRSLLLMDLPNEHQLTFSVGITQEDLNSEFLRSLPPEWNTHVVVWMNKADNETMSIDDLYNNFKIVEQDVKKSVGASTNAQNMAFMTTPSSSSTNDVNTANPTYEAMVLCITLSKKVESLESDLKQTKLTYGDVFSKLTIKVKKLEHKVKSSKARRRARLIVLKDEDDFENPSKQGRKIAQIDEDEGITLKLVLILIVPDFDCTSYYCPNGKLIHNSILNGPYVRRMITEPGNGERDVNVNETFHEQTDDQLSERELKQIEADDQ